MTPDFLNVGETEKIFLSELTVTGYEGDTDTQVYIQLINKDGTLKAQYNWRQKAKKGLQKEVKPGWYDYLETSKMVGTDIPDVEVPTGDGFLVYSANDSFKLVVSGAVRQPGKALSLTANGFKVTGNIFPKVTNLSTLTVSGYEGDTDTQVYIQLINKDGTLKAQYNWRQKAKKGLQKEVKPGWYDYLETSKMVGTDIPDVPLDPAQGFFIYSAVADMVLNFPALVPEENTEE